MGQVLVASKKFNEKENRQEECRRSRKDRANAGNESTSIHFNQRANGPSLKAHGGARRGSKRGGIRQFTEKGIKTLEKGPYFRPSSTAHKSNSLTGREGGFKKKGPLEKRKTLLAHM